VDERQPFGHGLDVGRQGEREDVAAHGEEQVVLHQERADRLAETREGAREERMREGEGAGGRHALLVHRGAEELRDLRHLGERVAVGDRVAGDQDGALGLDEEIGRGLDRRLVAADPRGDARGIQQIDLLLGVEHVHGQGDEDGTRGMGLGGLGSAAHGARQVGQPRDLVGPLDVGTRDGRQIGPQDGLRQVHRLVVLPGGEQERRAGLHGVVEHAHRVAEPGRGMHVDGGELAAGLGVAVGHGDGDRLLEGQDVADAGLAREAVHQRQLRGAGVAEHDLDTFLLEDLEESLLT
jgi:hypothetical protein